MPAKTPRGRFVWYELMTTDPDAARRFYPEVIGWSTQPWEEDESYVMWMNGESPVGAVMALPDEVKAMDVPPNWLAYVAVPDVDATAKQAAELGGKVLREPEDIPKVGRFSVIADPQGAVLCAFQPAEAPPGAEGPPKVGEFSWNELATTDHEAAFAFYSELFGWKKTDAMDMGEMGVYQMYGLGDQPLGGMFNKSAEMPGPPSWLYYIRVENVDEAAERVKGMGGEILNGPMEVPGGDRVVQCMDPQGAAFALHELAS